jgi:hypothetical protein
MQIQRLLLPEAFGEPRLGARQAAPHNPQKKPRPDDFERGEKRQRYIGLGRRVLQDRRQRVEPGRIGRRLR